MFVCNSLRALEFEYLFLLINYSIYILKKIMIVFLFLISNGNFIDIKKIFTKVYMEYKMGTINQSCKLHESIKSIIDQKD